MALRRLGFVLLVSALGLSSPACKDHTSPTPTATTTFTCADSASGSQVACTLDLNGAPGFTVSLDSSSCTRHGNEIRLLVPIDSTITVDACYATVGTFWHFPGPFPAGTSVSMEVVSAVLDHPPSLRVTGSYPTWYAVFEDGYDQDFNDLFMTIQADPTP